MADKSVFTPPVFANLGKSFRDLVKKKYDFDNAFKITSKTNFGLTLSTTGKVYKDKVAAATKAVYVDKSFGEVEGELDAGTNKLWGKVTLTRLLGNARFIVSGGYDPTSKDPLVKDSHSIKAEGEYRKDFLAASGSVLVGDEGKGAISSVVEGAAVIGYDNLSVGGQVKVKLDQAQQLSDYNVGAQYENKNFVASLLTENQGDVIRISYVHQINPDYQLGVEVLSDEFDHLAKPTDPRRRVLTLASQYQLDRDTLLKAKANNFGEVGAVVEHRLSKPSGLTVGAAAQFKATGSSRFATEKFGLSISVGDE